MKKDVFINGLDLIEDIKKFLNKIKNLKPYLIEFNKNDTIKDRIYVLNCIIVDEDYQLVIITTYNKYIFLINNSICKIWTRVGDTFYISKIENKVL